MRTLKDNDERDERSQTTIELMSRLPGSVVRSAEDGASSDRMLCAGLRASDMQALRDVFHLLRDELVRYVSTIIRDSNVAHDLVQDVFVSLWDLREKLDPDCALRSYVYRMARNRAYRHLRDERLHAAKHDLMIGERERAVPAPTLPDAETDGEILSAHLERWMAALPDRQREALSLSRFQGLSHREIAAVMGISARTVNNHILRALSNLEQKVQTLEPYESRS